MKDLLSTPEAKAALAGVAGALVRVLTLRERWWPDAAISLVVGGVSSVYFGPALEPALRKFFQMGQADAASLAGFIVGVSGILIVGGVLDFVHHRIRQHGGGSS